MVETTRRRAPVAHANSAEHRRDLANQLNGVTQDLESLIAAVAMLIESGTPMLFMQTAAPTGWTKLTTHNDKALRVVSGTASSGGTLGFSTVFAKTATDGHAVTDAEMPEHDHDFTYTNVTTASGAGVSRTISIADTGGAIPANTQSAGGGDPHSHGMDIRVAYVDVIIAEKD